MHSIRSPDHPDHFGYPEPIGRFGTFCFPPDYGGAALAPVKCGNHSHCRMDSFQKGSEERPGSGIAYRVTTLGGGCFVHPFLSIT